MEIDIADHKRPELRSCGACTFSAQYSSSTAVFYNQVLLGGNA